MKDKYISQGKNDKNKYLNNPLIVNNKNSKKIQFKNSFKFFNEMKSFVIYILIHTSRKEY